MCVLSSAVAPVYFSMTFFSSFFFFVCLPPGLSVLPYRLLFRVPSFWLENISICHYQMFFLCFQLKGCWNSIFDRIAPTLLILGLVGDLPILYFLENRTSFESFFGSFGFITVTFDPSRLILLNFVA